MEKSRESSRRGVGANVVWERREMRLRDGEERQSGGDRG
jgi:hypothetical protein